MIHNKRLNFGGAQHIRQMFFVLSDHNFVLFLLFKIAQNFKNIARTSTSLFVLYLPVSRVLICSQTETQSPVSGFFFVFLCEFFEKARNTQIFTYFSIYAAFFRKLRPAHTRATLGRGDLAAQGSLLHSTI